MVINFNQDIKTKNDKVSSLLLISCSDKILTTICRLLLSALLVDSYQTITTDVVRVPNNTKEVNQPNAECISEIDDFDFDHCEKGYGSYNKI
jgi:hypothetical protein